MWPACSRSAVTRSLPCSKKVKTLPDLSETVLPAQKGDIVEMDELWSFVRRKDQKRWIWLALCRRTRQIIAFAIGDRSEATCRILWSRLPKGYRAKRTYTDFWHAYEAVVPDWHHWPVGKDEGQTNHIERFNNTLRQR
ncbi:MAG: IS1 family transposase, partial [Armatimonadota bacterium]